MKHTSQGKYATTSAVKSIQAAEFAVLSSITVREEYKTKLRALLSLISPSSYPEALICDHGKNMPKLKQKKAKCVGLQAPVVTECKEGKEVHVLGDLLLLVRAASVDVVENIQVWREVVHEGIPRPYIYEHENYLLSMCEDLDFLDQVEDLADWLGFRLLRNPFIVDEALDDIVSSRLEVNVHDDRSLKYWNSASWRQNNKLSSKQGIVMNSSKSTTTQSKPATKIRWKKQPPPQPLIKPLASIDPEDDVVDGSRITAAQEILLDEESFHGRLLALKAAHEYVDRGPSIFERDNTDSNAEPPAVCDAIAAVNSQRKMTGYRSSLLRRERTQVERALQDLRNQMRWTEQRRNCDRTKDHRVRHCRDKYRQQALIMFTKLVETIERCLEVITGEENRFREVSDKYKGRMSELTVEKDKQRVARQQEERTAKHERIRKKTEERIAKFRPTKKNLQKRRQIDPELVMEGPEKIEKTTYEAIPVDIDSDIRVHVERKSKIPERSRERSEFIDSNLDEKRQRSIYQKRTRVEQQARTAKQNELVLDRRRAENMAMKSEDILSRAVERELMRKTRLKNRKEMADQVSSCAIYKCMHEMNGKRFLISLYIRNARGYDLEGLRIVAYDPSSSGSFTMVMTLREFNSLGYGRTSDGLGAFCRWLCLLYEKRRRQFRLVWSGTSCPPPLRVRVNDQALICVHKEGVKIQCSSSDKYSLVAVYIRTDNPSIARFVVSSWHGQEFLLTEHAVVAHHMILGSDLDVQWGSSGRTTIVWKHHAYGFKHEDHELTQDNTTSTSDVGQRIYSGEVTVNRSRYSVHLYDTNETEYTVELMAKLKKGETVQTTLHPVGNKLKLYKRKVNPYNVHLSSSNFADLMSLIRFEQTQSHEPVQETPEDDDSDHGCRKWKATISPKWAGKLAVYVRVLRLAKYACKIGGVFCFIAVFIVQQKTEFRAHLLLEITWLAPTLSSPFSLGGVATRQSVRIALSDYIRCVTASRRFTMGLSYSSGEVEGQVECPSCEAYSASRTNFYENELNPMPEATFDYSTSCSNCAMIQHRRLHAIKELIIHVSGIAPESLEFIYHGYCDVCATLAPPIILVLGSTLSPAMMMWLRPRLEHYFASFDCSKNGFMHIVVEGEGPSIAEENAHVRETFLQTLARDQVTVLVNADCGITVTRTNLFVHELHWWLYPDHNDLPCHVAYVVDNHNGKNHFEKSESGGYRDSDLLEALQALNHAAGQVAELDPVQLDDDGAKEIDRASAFDAYLVAEAVLVEAIRVLLRPDYAWQKPREIVGASSWSSACKFLLDPVELSTNLQQFDPLRLSEAASEVLDAYFAHTKWPHDYPNVRPFFYGLLAFMMHVQYVRQILIVKSGSLQSLLKKHPVTEGETTAEYEQLAKNTSIIDCSNRGHACESPRELE